MLGWWWRTLGGTQREKTLGDLGAVFVVVVACCRCGVLEVEAVVVAQKRGCRARAPHLTLEALVTADIVYVVCTDDSGGGGGALFANQPGVDARTRSQRVFLVLVVGGIGVGILLR